MSGEKNDEAAKAAEFTKGIYEKLLQLGASERCPICGNLNWYVVDNPGMGGLVVLTDNRSIPAYTLMCDRCGFVRQHGRTVVDGLIPKKVDDGAG